jgi:hypothetical protein
MKATARCLGGTERWLSLLGFRPASAQQEDGCDNHEDEDDCFHGLGLERQSYAADTDAGKRASSKSNTSWPSRNDARRGRNVRCDLQVGQVLAQQV